METSLNNEMVKQAANSSNTATKTMVLLGIRRRARTFTSMGKIKEQLYRMGEQVDDKDYKAFWKDLEAAGAGSVILGRRGKETRFEWSYSLKDIARIAIEGHEAEVQRIETKQPKNSVSKAIDTLVKRKPGRPRKEVAPIKQEKLVYRIPLRSDFVLEVNLPADVSAEELHKIGNSFIPINV